MVKDPMKKLQMLFVFLIFTCSLILSACDFLPVGTPLKVSGYVYYNSSPLENVAIKTSTQKLCETNSEGFFTFETNKSQITIYAEKTGYLFQPKSITLTSNNNNVIITAQAIENLNGVLSLSQINITPSSIVSVSDNFQYVKDGQNCLKIKNFYVEVNNKKINCIEDDFYAVKNKTNIINFNDDISIETNTPFSIKFSLDAYFTSYHNEYYFEEEKITVLDITQPQTTAILTENNQIEYSFWGVNASNNKFSYNVTFVFDYYPNV